MEIRASGKTGRGVIHFMSTRVINFYENIRFPIFKTGKVSSALNN